VSVVLCDQVSSPQEMERKAETHLPEVKPQSERKEGENNE
jgi:hypothetical protein